MKIGILGAGISGLSVARLLQDKFEVQVFEKKSTPGGIARTREVDGISYHLTGGHCFNSKFPEVLDFVFDDILPKDEWNQITRNAKIKFKGELISYPIEFSIKEIAKFDIDLAQKMVRDFLNTNDDSEAANNLEDWFRRKFGDTLAEAYFIPYNRKIWNMDVKTMSPEWVEGKLPIPDKKVFFKSLFSAENDKMPHSTFFYPVSNNQNTFIDNLAKGLNIKYDFEISSIEKSASGNKWLLNSESEFDIIINTLPLNILPLLYRNCSHKIIESASKLKYNKVTTMLWETEYTDATWTYLPSEESIFHRYIHIGNFFSPKRNITITESVGEKSYDEMLLNGKKDSFLLKPIDYHVSDHAYVVFDENHFKYKAQILEYFAEEKIYNLGRFAEWEYYNMDVCIAQSIKMAQLLKSQY